MRRTATHHLELLLILILVAWAALAEAQEANIPPGVYTYAGGDAQRRAFSKAIDDVVGEMNALIRGIARERLSRRLKIEPRISFEPGDGSVRLAHAPLPPRSIDLEGASLQMRNAAGDRVQVTYRLGNRLVTEIIRSGRSSQRNTYRFSPDGRRLTFTVAIRSPMLPAAIRYTLTYRRRSTPAGSVVRR